MAIIKMNKFTLLALESQKEVLLRNLQLFQGVEFINLQEEENLQNIDQLRDLNKDTLSKNYGDLQENIIKVKFILELVNNYAPSKGGILSMFDDKRSLSYGEIDKKVTSLNWQEDWKDLTNLERRLSDIENEKNRLQGEIKLLEKWSGFDAPFSYLEDLRQCAYFIGSVAKQQEEKLINDFSHNINAGYIELVGSDVQDSYFFAITTKELRGEAEEILKLNGFIPYTIVYKESPGEIIKDYGKKISNLQDEKQKIENKIIAYKDKILDFQMVYEYYNTLLLRMDATKNFLKTNNVVTILGWVPEENKEELKEVIKEDLGDNFYISFEEPKEEEISQVPIKLKNNGFVSSFEGVVEMYSLPQYSEVDPTPLMSVFYFIFFGMMLSDAGYGLLMVIASSIAIKLVKDKKKAKSYKLFFFAGISTVIWGAIYGSWFGDLLPNYLGIKIPYLIDPPNSITEILVISVIFGLLHIFVGLGIKAYMYIKGGMWKDAIYDVATWYAVLIGAIMMLLGVGTAGLVILILGLVGLLLTQGRSYPSIGAKIGWGIYGVYGVTSYLGDIVSYSRLMALGLATGFISNAFNLIISLIPSPFSYLMAPVLFVVFHTFNLLVNALGSYVHAARLQYLEFFNKFYEGGGKKFEPYKLSEEYIKITK